MMIQQIKLKFDVKCGFFLSAGSEHLLVSLEELAAELGKETKGLRRKAQHKYEELSSMLKVIYRFFEKFNMLLPSMK